MDSTIDNMSDNLEINPDDLQANSDVLQALTTIGSTVDEPDNDDAEVTEVHSSKIRFFKLIPGLQHIEIDPSMAPPCGPLSWSPNLPRKPPTEDGAAIHATGALSRRPAAPEAASRRLGVSNPTSD